MANAIYNIYKKAVEDGTVNLVTDTIKVMLVTSTYVPLIRTHIFKSDVTNEVSGTGYTAGGMTLTGKSATQDNVNDRGVFTAGTLTWSTSTITARGAVIYKDTGISTTSILVGYVDFTSDKMSSGGDFVITWNAAGILNLT